MILLNLLGIAKPTPSVLSVPPFQKIVQHFCLTLSVSAHLNSLKAQMSMFAFSSLLQMIAVACSGLILSHQLFVVRTFQSARLRSCLSFLSWTLVHLFTSVTPDVVKFEKICFCNVCTGKCFYRVS